jgi:hypothetical protein
MKLFDTLDEDSQRNLPWPFRLWFIQPVWLGVATIVAVVIRSVGSNLLPEFSMLQVKVFTPFFATSFLWAAFVMREIMRTKA